MVNGVSDVLEDAGFKVFGTRKKAAKLEASKIITKEFMVKHKIDLVVHAFQNSNDDNKQISFFKYPKSINKFKEIEYCNECNTTEIINKIKTNY